MRPRLYLKKTKPSLSAEHSGVRSALVKTYRGKVSPVQTTVFGNSLKPGVFPKMWKVRVFVFVYKSGDRSGVSNYFPSSYSLCKTFEMVVHNPLHSFLGVYLYPLNTASLLIWQCWHNAAKHFCVQHMRPCAWLQKYLSGRERLARLGGTQGPTTRVRIRPFIADLFCQFCAIFRKHFPFVAICGRHENP